MAVALPDTDGRGRSGKVPPRAHPRPGRPVTAAYLDRAAVAYLERYASSAENLRRVLARKARARAGREAEPDPNLPALIEDSVARAVRSGLVDDRSYADAKLGSLLRRGASTRTARATLKAKGVAADTVSDALAEAAPDDLAQARRYAERRRLGPWRREPDPALRERDLAALCRAGFPYRVARVALETGDGNG